MFYEIVNQRLPREKPVGQSSSCLESRIHWEKIGEEICSPEQPHAIILRELGPFIGWPLATYDYPAVDDLHQFHVDRSANYVKEAFLESSVYQAWKNRKARGPGLLCATGSGMSTSLLKQIFVRLRMRLEEKLKEP